MRDLTGSLGCRAEDKKEETGRSGRWCLQHLSWEVMGWTWERVTEAGRTPEEARGKIVRNGGSMQREGCEAFLQEEVRGQALMPV